MINNIKTIAAILLLSLLTTITGYSKSFYSYYETKTIPSGYSLLGFSTKLSYTGIDTIFKSTDIPDGLIIFKLNPSTNGYVSWTVFMYDAFLGGWNFAPDDTNAVINFGETVYVNSPISFETVFTGQVVQNSTTTIKKGYNLISTKTMKNGGVSTVHGLSPNNGDMIYKRTNNAWMIYTFEDGPVGNWLPSEPTFGPSEGFFYLSVNQFDWPQYQILPNPYNSLVGREFLGTFYMNILTDPPGLNRKIFCMGVQKANIEGTIQFSYSPTLESSTWYDFALYDPIQPIDTYYVQEWVVGPFSRFGYIRVSTY